MVLFDNNDRLLIDNWLNNKGEIPDKIQNIINNQKNNQSLSYILLLTNRTGKNIFENSKKENIIIDIDGQTLKISKTNNSVIELFKSFNKTLFTDSKIKSFSICIDFFMILDIESFLLKNIKRYILDKIELDKEYIFLSKPKSIYLSFDKNSKKINTNCFIDEFIDYEKSKKINYYYINYKKTLSKLN